MSSYEQLQKFFEENALAIQAAASIKNGREIEFVIKSDTGSESCTFTKTNGKNQFKQGAASSPDLRFTLSPEAVAELTSKSFSTVGQVALHIFEKMLSNDPKQKIQAKILVGFLSLMTGGYLGVLTAGGGEVTKFLATKGLGNMGKLKDAISKLKG